ncbi:MAG: DUF421 domain-containing protein [Bacteroidota bacterium]|nr:DUF421 domain-containing protein [Bacteroidota bacterium]
MNEKTFFENLLFGESGIEFLPEIILRAAMVFFILLFALRVLGKRGVRQLSVFEMAIIISLGTAAGDPMIYKEIGVFMAATVFISIVICYRLIVALVGKSKTIEILIEGKPICLVRDGVFSIEEFSKETMAQDEFFAELREQHVEHLGQLRLALEETSGEMSLYFFEDKKVSYGLPIIPEIFNQKSKIILTKGYYSCTFCGLTELLEPKEQFVCERCKHDEWVASINSKRIS